MKPLMWIMILGLSFRDVYSDYCPQRTTCSSTCYRSSKYHRDCGLFGWRRCTKYRRRSFTCYVTCYQQACCTGYTGSSCNTPLCDGSMSCPNGGTCRSPDYCVCPTGFSAPLCSDIDECSGTSHGCQHDCRNTAGSYDCTCRAGYVRSYDLKTCIVDCGHPGDINNGRVSVSSTLSGGPATYTCNTDYSMTSGDRVRYCQNDFTWSGTEPTCIFSNHCNSSPCRNGATCVNFVGGFRCTCSQWWSGQICETDIQPPVLTGCSEDVHINATDHTVQYSWTEPTFTDPRGSDLNIVSNYPSSEFTFPWGDYTVQYVATKTSNGLQTECSFQIKVRPTPCEELNVPVNGARLCNGWKTDYGRFCMIMCQQNYTIGPSQSYYTWHVCGASGNWIAASPVPDCEVPVTYEYEDEYYHPEYAGYVYSSSCEDDATRNTLQTLYIDYLKGTDGFSSFCSTYESECMKENVDVKC
ncbi:neurogenic locus notch homolog protein 1-like isoform X3 [Mercenaria mercenaria]|uniref:neurogenic locus notch homolog protein 1-like isoform X3 n=1 Tax=Mercenaria mercenaria TaxID=6596 RepID=UPI00234E7539|nr:neurogenic locus notch homolog protein 1-like isoform X3 [Mercenaria mercenaria]